MYLDVDKFWRDGFIIIRNAITPSKVERWRNESFSAVPGRDLLSNSVLAEVICDPVIVNAASQILGGQPTYFGDSTVMRGTGGGIGFHKDNSDRLDKDAPDWGVSRYPFVRFGVYTQSHGRLPNGLDLRLGSHNYPDFTSGEMVSAAVEPGDLVAWNGRTTHSGNSKIFKMSGRRLVPDSSKTFVKIVNKLGGLPWLFTSHPQERVAIFASYALPGPLLDRHIEYLRQREYAIDLWKNSEWSASARKLANEVGLNLLDVTGFQHDGRELHRFYHPIPY